MRVVSILFLSCFCACTSFKAPLPPDPPGIYQGYDSALFVNDRYGEKMFGECLKVAGVPDSALSFNEIDLEPLGNHEFSFDYTDTVDYGIATHHDFHYVRRRGIFKFTYNHLVVEYAVGEVGAPESQYRFNGWR
jgi:hypothetical protein